MSKNNYVIPPEILEVLGPPPLLASENPKRWNETLARYAQSYPPKDAYDFEGWRNVWNLACDHWEEERMKRFKVEILEAPRRAKLEQELLARVDKIEDELRGQAIIQALDEWQRRYPGSSRRAEANEKLPAETKGLRADADPKLPAEAQTIPAVTATEPAPLLPSATDADYADAFAENLHIYCCADQIQNSARKRYDAVRDQIDLRRAAELASKMVNGEVAPTERQLQSSELSSVEHLSESAPATTSVLLSSMRSTQLLAPPNSPEPQESSQVSTASTVDAAPAIEPSTALGEGGTASVPPDMDSKNIENNNVATDPSLAAPPGVRASTSGTSVTSTVVTASVGSIIAGAMIPEPTPAAERKDERDRVESPDALVQPSQQHRGTSAQKESEADRIARIRAWVRKERARRDAERARGQTR
jgi:hypothetical protein